jgi:hypothetical protein
MKKLFEIEVTLYAVGETKEEAMDALADDAGMWDICENSDIYEVDSVLSIWSNAYPFGDEDSKTCSEYLEDIREFKRKEAERRKWEARQKKLF